jgi:hypothetical protein
MRGEVKLQKAADDLLKRVEIAEKRQDIQKKLIGHLLEHNEKLEKELSNVRMSYSSFDLELREYREKCDDHLEVKRRQAQWEADREANRLRQQIKRMSKELEEYKSIDRQIEQDKSQRESFAYQYDIARAKTIAIYDNILFAIENWSIDGQTAGDVTLLFQSILFPVIYESVMSGDEDYYFEEVPVGALEFVKRAREYVRHIRLAQPAAVTSSEDIWLSVRPDFHNWLLNDGLPLLYGACADSWNSIESISLADMLKWRDEPASRALEFPLIFDAIELISNNGDEIRSTKGLPEFTKQTLNTRIEP